jgi:hypothetical protein
MAESHSVHCGPKLKVQESHPGPHCAWGQLPPTGSQYLPWVRVQAPLAGGGLVTGPETGLLDPSPNILGSMCQVQAPPLNAI